MYPQRLGRVTPCLRFPAFHLDFAFFDYTAVLILEENHFQLVAN